MQAATSFEDLIVWQKAHRWVLSVYELTKKFPSHETYGLVSQFRRSAVSVPANIAEGFKKKGNLDKRRFLNIAQGSLEESKYYTILTKDLGYGSCEMMGSVINEIARMLNAYMRAIDS